MKAECPCCFWLVDLAADTVVNEVITCPDCGSDLEVVCLKPIPKLRQAEKLKEDHGE